MLEKDKIVLRDASPYHAALTREQFLFYEVRTPAKLVCEGTCFSTRQKSP